MKIRFMVYHSFGLHHMEDFDLEDFDLEWSLIGEVSKSNEMLLNLIRPYLIDWTKQHYNHSDAMPSWEVVYIQ